MHHLAQDRSLQDSQQLAASPAVDVLVDPWSHQSPRSQVQIDAESARRALHGAGMLGLPSGPLVLRGEARHQLQPGGEPAGAVAQVGAGAVEVSWTAKTLRGWSGVTVPS